MRILVTGGAGYIGSATARLLRASGHDVVILDHLGNGHPAAVPGMRLVVGDCRDGVIVESLLRDERIDAVVHFAALKSVEESVADPGSYFDNNVGGTLTVLRAMAAASVHRFVFSSSCAVYGIPASLPVGEDTALRPMNPYGESKLLAERLLPWFDATHGIRSAALRYFNAAGAAADGSAGEDWRDAANLIPIVLGVAAGRRPALTVNGMDLPTPDGSAVRDYIHVDDLAAAHIRALETIDRLDASLTVNVGTGRGASVLDIVAAARRITGQPIPIVAGPARPGDPPAVWADTRLAEATLGWRAQASLDDILATAWAWHRQHPDGYLPTSVDAAGMAATTHGPRADQAMAGTVGS
jgi:UDP-glucose 4-epimerase